MTRASGMYHAPSPAGSRTPVGQHTHIHPRRPRLVIAMRCLLYEIWGVTTWLAPEGRVLILEQHGFNQTKQLEPGPHPREATASDPDGNTAWQNQSCGSGICSKKRAAQRPRSVMYADYRESHLLQAGEQSNEEKSSAETKEHLKNSCPQ